MRLEEMTLGEIERLEEAAHMSISQIDDPKAPKGRMMHAIAFIAMQRQDPSFTWEQAGELTMSEMDALVTLADDADPTDAIRPNG